MKTQGFGTRLPGFKSCFAAYCNFRNLLNLSILYFFIWKKSHWEEALHSILAQWYELMWPVIRCLVHIKPSGEVRSYHYQHLKKTVFSFAIHHNLQSCERLRTSDSAGSLILIKNWTITDPALGSVNTVLHSSFCRQSQLRNVLSGQEHLIQTSLWNEGSFCVRGRVRQWCPRNSEILLVLVTVLFTVDTARKYTPESPVSLLKSTDTPRKPHSQLVSFLRTMHLDKLPLQRAGSLGVHPLSWPNLPRNVATLMLPTCKHSAIKPTQCCHVGACESEILCKYQWVLMLSERSHSQKRPILYDCTLVRYLESSQL